jgi:hypothetical protein
MRPSQIFFAIMAGLVSTNFVFASSATAQSSKVARSEACKDTLANRNQIQFNDYEVDTIVYECLTGSMEFDDRPYDQFKSPNRSLHAVSLPVVAHTITSPAQLPSNATILEAAKVLYANSDLLVKHTEAIKENLQAMDQAGQLEYLVCTLQIDLATCEEAHGLFAIQGQTMRALLNKALTYLIPGMDGLIRLLDGHGKSEAALVKGFADTAQWLVNEYPHGDEATPEVKAWVNIYRLYRAQLAITSDKMGLGLVTTEPKQGEEKVMLRRSI